ncbi:MAG: transposase [Bacteroidota bacterium]
MDILSQLSELLPILPPFELERAERDEAKQEVHLYLKLDKSHIPKGYSLHSHYPRSWEHLKLFEYRCFIHCDLPIYKHKQSGKLKKAEVSFSRDYSRFTLKYEAEVMRLMKLHHCFVKVAQTLGIYPQRVEQIYHYHTAELQGDYLSEVPTHIGYDETTTVAASTRKGHEYITTFYDMDTHQIIGIYEGRSSECVTAFMHDHPNPQAVQEISIDRSPAFIKGARQCFPQAAITFDKWHVIKLLYKHLGNLKGKAHRFNVLIELLMEKLSAFYQSKGKEEGAAQLRFIADLAYELIGKNAITNTIDRYWEGICR